MPLGPELGLPRLVDLVHNGIPTYSWAYADRDAWLHPLKVVRSLFRLRKSPFVTPRAAKQLLQYNERGFHPNDRDTSALISEWRERLFGPDGELTDVLAA